MTTTATERVSLSALAAREITAELGRRRPRMSFRELARRLGERPMWVSVRIGDSASVPLTLDDIERIAWVLEVSPLQLIPEPKIRPADRDSYRGLPNQPDGRPDDARHFSPEGPVRLRPTQPKVRRLTTGAAPRKSTDRPAFNPNWREKATRPANRRTGISRSSSAPISPSAARTIGRRSGQHDLISA